MRTFATALALSCLGSAAAHAQGFQIKPTLAAAGITGCSVAEPIRQSSPATRPTPAATQEVLGLIADAEEAALQGEHAAAREAFAKAAQLDPTNARVAYYLGRELEALQEAGPAVREYCRYLALLPNAPDAPDVRGRIVRLTPPGELQRMDNARANFQSGVALLSRRQYAAADSVFTAVARVVPGAPEPYFNRALSRAARGEREPAVQDFDRYLQLAPAAVDGGTVRTAMARLPEEVYGPGQAFTTGMLTPGLGQMSTGRPIRGVLALGLVGGLTALALGTETKIVAETYEDPFGTPYVDSIPRTTRPRLFVSAVAAGIVWFGAAMEASVYASRSRRRAQSIIAPASGASAGTEVQLTIREFPSGRIGIGLQLR
ncbi:MAG: tetratricopeptide repeat protein [Gemmatimonadota bacterium]